jgi:hypothetical protein
MNVFATILNYLDTSVFSLLNGLILQPVCGLFIVLCVGVAA